jgi:hypothetical protein
MSIITTICYLSSLLFYGMGYSKTLDIKNAGTVNTYDYGINVSLATCYFILAISLAVIGSLSYFIKNSREQKISETRNVECRENTGKMPKVFETDII